MSRAKSMVTGDPEEITETAIPPPWGIRVAPVKVTVKDTTSQIGASPPKSTTDPMLGLVPFELLLEAGAEEELPPQPGIIKGMNAVRIISGNA